MALNALGTNAVTDSWVMKERDIQIFWKSIKFPCNDTQKKGKNKRLKHFENGNRFGLRWSEKKKQTNKLRTHCSKRTLRAYCKFGNARQSEAISTEEVARKLWALVNIFKEADSNWLGVFTSIQISWRNLNKVLPIDSFEQKVITPGDIASDSKVYIDEKEDYVMQMAQRRHVFSPCM